VAAPGLRVANAAGKVFSKVPSIGGLRSARRTSPVKNRLDAHRHYPIVIVDRDRCRMVNTAHRSFAPGDFPQQSGEACIVSQPRLLR
jgi:hypothetical protein